MSLAIHVPGSSCTIYIILHNQTTRPVGAATSLTVWHTPNAQLHAFPSATKNQLTMSSFFISRSASCSFRLLRRPSSASTCNRNGVVD